MVKLFCWRNKNDNIKRQTDMIKILLKEIQRLERVIEDLKKHS